MHLPSATRESVSAALLAQGIQPTRQRVEIAMALLGRHEHLSADQVLARVNESHPETSRATVYNTLRLFVDKRLVREVIVDPNRLFYDSNVEPHYHLYDVDTGCLTDIPATSVTITGLPDLPAHLVPEGMDVIIRVRSASPVTRP